MPEAKDTLRRGLKEIFAAEVLTDDNGTDGYTVGTPFALIPAGEMSRQVSRDTADIYFDDVVFHRTGNEGATEISITGASLRQAKIATLLAKNIDSTTGAIIDSGEFSEKYFALGGTTENVDGTEEKFWFAKGTFAINSRADKTKDDTTDTNGDELVYSAIKTIHLFNNKPLKKIVIDSAVTEMKSNQNWNAQVVTPDNLSTICQKVSS